MYVDAVYLSGIGGSWRKVLDALELYLQIVVSLGVDVGN